MGSKGGKVGREFLDEHIVHYLYYWVDQSVWGFLGMSMCVSQTLPLENGCVRPDVRTAHRTLRMENEELGSLHTTGRRIFSLGDSWLHTVPAWCRC